MAPLYRFGSVAFWLTALVLVVANFTGTTHLLPEWMTAAGVSLAMASASDTSTLNTVGADYLEFVDAAKVYNLIWEANPTLTRIAKKADVTGAYYAHSVVFGGSGGQSNSYTSAYNNQTPLQQATFHVPMSETFHLGTLDNHAVAAARNKKGAFQPLVEEAYETGIKLVANKLSVQILGSGTNTLGQISNIQVLPSGYASGTAKLELTDPNNYRNFEYQATFNITSTNGGAPLGVPDTFTVLEVDAAGRILIVSAPSAGSWNSGSFVVGIFLIQAGDYLATAFGNSISTQSGITGYQPQPFAGFGAWVPSYAYRQNPGLRASNFFNVPRNVNGTRLAGQSYPGQSMSIPQALINASVQAATFGTPGTMPEYATLGPAAYGALLNQFQGQKLYMDDEIDAGIAYRGVFVLQGGAKDMKVIMDPSCPAGVAYLWSPDDFMLCSVDGLPRPIPYQSGAFRDVEGTNQIEYRCGGYGNLVCKNPRNVVNVTISA